MRIGLAGFSSYFLDHVDGLLVFVASIILANYLAGSYRLQSSFSRFNLVITWLFSLAFALIMLSITSYAWFEILLGRGVLLAWVTSYSILSLASKMFVYRALFRSLMFQCKTAIVGVDGRALELRQILENRFVLPAHKVVAFIRLVDNRPAENERTRETLGGITVIETTASGINRLVRRLGVNLLVVAIKGSEMTRLYPQLRRLRFEGVEVLTPLSVYELYSGRTPLDLINDEALTALSLESGLPMMRRVKRVIDIVLSLTAGVLILPLAVVVGLAIKLSSPRSPVLYTQLRVGQFGKTFRIYKFRTMYDNAEQTTGPVWAAADDKRITRLGRFLRQYRIDELPQLINVLKGEMSLVGPRPERPSISVDLAKKIPFFEERENVMPGLTGWAQIRYPYGSSLEDAIRKLEYDLYYIKHVSLSLDLQIILSTLRIVLLGKERRV